MTLSINPLPFKEAIAALRARGVVLPEVYYDERQRLARAQSFTVTGVAKLDQLQRALDSLADALAKGDTLETWKQNLTDEMLELPAHRLETIFRTNIQGAYARGRCVSIKQNKATRPYFRYVAINDSRTRPAHLAMHGYTAPVGDPIWNTWTPPAGFNCRCTVVSLTEAQAATYRERDAARLGESEDLTKARQAALQSGPDQGWGYSVCSEPTRGIEQSAQSKSYHPAFTGFVGRLISAMGDILAGTDRPKGGNKYTADMSALLRGGGIAVSGGDAMIADPTPRRTKR